MIEDRFLEGKQTFYNGDINGAMAIFEQGVLEGDVKCIYGMSTLLEASLKRKQARNAMSAMLTPHISEYERLASEGDITAMLIMASCYLDGMGVNSDMAKALTYVHKAADLGSSEALVMLGYLYKRTHGRLMKLDKELGLFKELHEFPGYKELFN